MTDASDMARFAFEVGQKGADWMDRANAAEARVAELEMGKGSLWRQLNERLMRAEARADIAEARVAELERVESAARALAHYVKTSVNAGPVTKGPHKEAALCCQLKWCDRPVTPPHRFCSFTHAAEAVLGADHPRLKRERSRYVKQIEAWYRANKIPLGQWPCWLFLIDDSLEEIPWEAKIYDG